MSFNSITSTDGSIVRLFEGKIKARCDRQKTMARLSTKRPQRPPQILIAIHPKRKTHHTKIAPPLAPGPPHISAGREPSGSAAGNVKIMIYPQAYHITFGVYL